MNQWAYELYVNGERRIVGNAETAMILVNLRTQVDMSFGHPAPVLITVHELGAGTVVGTLSYLPTEKTSENDT